MGILRFAQDDNVRKYGAIEAFVQPKAAVPLKSNARSFVATLLRMTPQK